jgi:hypothetical protein
MRDGGGSWPIMMSKMVVTAGYPNQSPTLRL